MLAHVALPNDPGYLMAHTSCDAPFDHTPLYDSLIEGQSTAGVPVEDLRTRLANARDGLKTLLIAWARYEDELPEGPQRQRAQNARDDWGRVARDFLIGED